MPRSFVVWSVGALAAIACGGCVVSPAALSFQHTGRLVPEGPGSVGVAAGAFVPDVSGPFPFLAFVGTYRRRLAPRLEIEGGALITSTLLEGTFEFGGNHHRLERVFNGAQLRVGVAYALRAERRWASAVLVGLSGGESSDDIGHPFGVIAADVGNVTSARPARWLGLYFGVRVSFISGFNDVEDWYLQYLVQEAVGARFELHWRVALYLEIGCGHSVITDSRATVPPDQPPNPDGSPAEVRPFRTFGAGLGLGLEVVLGRRGNSDRNTLTANSP